MINNRNDSLSPLTSSSEASVKLYEETIKPKIDAIRKCNVDVDKLLSDAKKFVDDNLASQPQRTFRCETITKEISVELDKIMLAMLECSDECGGTLYVASAIMACSKLPDIIEALAALGTTWLTHFLFIFKMNKGQGKQTRVGDRRNSFRDDVMIRDGYTCVVTGTQDNSHPMPEEVYQANLKATHILQVRRAVGHFDADHESKSFQSAVTTFDILVNFSNLPLESLEELRNEISHPSNGILLQYDAHRAFENFSWYLSKTQTAHVYNLEILKNTGLLRKPENNLVTFTDRSNDFLSNSSRPAIDLPNPQYIAIHAAIARVLHISRAGKFFDQLLEDYKYEHHFAAVRSWAELEELMERKLLKDSIAEAFRMVMLH